MAHASQTGYDLPGSGYNAFISDLTRHGAFNALGLLAVIFYSKVNRCSQFTMLMHFFY